jgi:UDP-N-acetylmuramoyl-tripeptide--D-alanyl-D-alanine ligase
MGELGKGGARFHREAGRKVHESGFHLLLTLGKLGRETVKGARSAGMKACFSFTDPAALLLALRRKVRRGDLVLIKGSHSMKMEALAATFLKGEK